MAAYCKICYGDKTVSKYVDKQFIDETCTHCGGTGKEPLVDGPAPKDRLGREIKEGAILAYGHLLRRSAGLRIGKVMRVEHREGRRGVDTTLTVWGIDEGWSGSKPALCKLSGTLLYPERTVVLLAETVPEEYRKLLEPVQRDSTATSLGIKR